MSHSADMRFFVVVAIDQPGISICQVNHILPALARLGLWPRMLSESVRFPSYVS